MWGKLLAALAIVAIVGAAALVGDRIVVAYGDARYSAGKADAQVAAVPGILAANRQAMQAGLDGRDAVIAAQTTSLDELARLSGLFAASSKKWTDYAQTAAGRALCIDTKRVLDIEADRAATFLPAAPAARTGSAQGRSVPADPVTQGSGRQP